MKELPDVSKNILLKKPKKCLKTPIENCNSTTEVALMCITYSWYVDGVMYPEMFQSSKDTSHSAYVATETESVRANIDGSY